MEGLHAGIMVPAILLILIPLALVWFIVFGGIFLTLRKRLWKNRKNLFCSADSDCPEGYICAGGKCVLAQ